jgi:DNA-binding transcriptional regulator YiaG
LARKVEDKQFERIIELREKYGLTAPVIATRLGISVRTVHVYLRAHREQLKPYEIPNASC